MAQFALDHARVENPIGMMHALWRALVGRLGNTVRLWRAYERAFSELSSLNDYELHDIGISRCSIPWIARQTALASALTAPPEKKAGRKAPRPPGWSELDWEA